MAFVRKNLSKWILAAIVITIGVLCIVAGATWNNGGAQDSLDAISVVLGVVLIVVGALSLLLGILAVILTKAQLLAVALSGALSIALGISLIVAKYAASLILILITVIPYALIAIGLVVLADSVITLVKGIIAKKVKLVLFGSIAGIVIGATSAVLGFLCVDFGGSKVIPTEAQLIVFGIIVALYGLFMVLASFMPNATLVVVAESKSE